MAHEWYLSSEVIGEAIYAVAICGRCGTTRAAQVPTHGDAGVVDLRSVCPGKPIDPPDPPVPQFA
jgi:hypothetical protein